MERTTSKIDLEAALRDPTACFGEPQDVVDDPHLSREDKLAILRCWQHDALRLSTSEAEGMVGGEDAMLRRVELAIQAVSQGR